MDSLLVGAFKVKQTNIPVVFPRDFPVTVGIRDIYSNPHGNPARPQHYSYLLSSHIPLYSQHIPPRADSMCTQCEINAITRRHEE